MRARTRLIILGLVIFVAANRSGFAQSVISPPYENVKYENVKYGPHERNVLDFWQAKSDRPTPLLVSIHGGGFLVGEKTVPKQLLKDCLDAGISVAAINYRFSSQAIAPAAFYDGARAIQFLRHQAKAWNIDPNRVVSSGESAGAGISLWLAFHKDLADPNSSDPISRESTRLTCAIVYEGQSSYDPRFVRNMFPGRDIHKVMPLQKLFDVDMEKLDELPAEKYKLFEEVSAINHVTADAPPVQLWYANPMDVEVSTQRIGIHHPMFGKLLKEKMATFNRRCEVVAAGKQLDGSPATPAIQFLKRQFAMDN